MKIGIVGKGGTGKTTTTALLAQEYVAQGRRVLAIDSDSNPNLAFSLGLDAAAVARVPIVPRSLAVGSGGGAVAPGDLLHRFGVETPSGVTVLNAMAVTDAGAGCTCGSHGSVRSILGAAMDDEADVTLVDMEAGLEHLSRSGGTLAYSDILLVVMQPSRKAVATAARTAELAEQLGIPRVYGVGNKARHSEDEDFFRSVAAEYGVRLAGVVPHDDDITAADRDARMVGVGEAVRARRAVADLVRFVESPDAEREALLQARDRLDQRLASLAGEEPSGQS